MKNLEEDILQGWQSAQILHQFKHADAAQVSAALGRRDLSLADLATLLSPAALHRLEDLALCARELTLRHFGASVHLFTPLYISNYCENSCRYCSFSCSNVIERQHLSINQVGQAARKIAATGMRNVLMLTGESRVHAGPQYLGAAAKELCREFSTVSIEVYPLQEDEYAALIDDGVSGLTLYQEVYDRQQYAQLHPAGPKSDYAYRLEAPQRACKAGMHAITLGPLLGLSDWRREVLALAIHLRHIQHWYPGVELSVSFPRMRPFAADFPVPHAVDDHCFVQILAALRIFAPAVGITMSTRESTSMRDNCAGIAVTKMSAGVSTTVGGEPDGPSQFEIDDNRTLEQVCAALRQRGRQPVMHDWNASFFAPAVPA